MNLAELEREHKRVTERIRDAYRKLARLESSGAKPEQVNKVRVELMHDKVRLSNINTEMDRVRRMK